MTRISKLGSLVLVASLLASACGDVGLEATQESQAPARAETTAAPTANPTTVPQIAPTESEATSVSTVPERTELNLTFNGEGCVFEGPDELAAGAVELAYRNDSDEKAWVAFNRHTGDESVEDAIAHFGEGPSSIACPSWKRDVARYSVAAGDTDRWEGVLEAGTYHMVCYQYPPLAVWFGTGLTVNVDTDSDTGADE